MTWYQAWHEKKQTRPKRNSQQLPAKGNHTLVNNFHDPSLLTSTKPREKKNHDRNTRNTKQFSSTSATLKIHPHITLNEALLLPTPNDPTLAADGATTLYL